MDKHHARCEKIACVNDINIYIYDVETIMPGQWLNDNAITFCLEVLLSELERKIREQVYLVHASMCEIVKAVRDPEILVTLLPDANLQERELVLFIVNDNPDPDLVLGGNHWTLLVWEKSRKRFIFYDSLSSTQSLMLARQIYISMRSLLISDGPHSFDCGVCPRQTNSNDCGMHVIETARIIMQKGTEAVPSDRFPFDMATRRREWIDLINKV